MLSQSPSFLQVTNTVFNYVISALRLFIRSPTLFENCKLHSRYSLHIFLHLHLNYLSTDNHARCFNKSCFYQIFYCFSPEFTRYSRRQSWEESVPCARERDCWKGSWKAGLIVVVRVNGKRHFNWCVCVCTCATNNHFILLIEAQKNQFSYLVQS